MTSEQKSALLEVFPDADYISGDHTGSTVDTPGSVTLDQLLSMAAILATWDITVHGGDEGSGGVFIFAAPHKAAHDDR